MRKLQLRRKSTREFKDYIDIQDLSNVLLNSYFITEYFETHTHHLRRSIPSGGALYPIDLYYININTKNLQQGFIITARIKVIWFVIKNTGILSQRWMH